MSDFITRYTITFDLFVCTYTVYYVYIAGCVVNYRPPPPPLALDGHSFAGASRHMVFPVVFVVVFLNGMVFLMV